MNLIPMGSITAEQPTLNNDQTGEQYLKAQQINDSITTENHTVNQEQDSEIHNMESKDSEALKNTVESHNDNNNDGKRSIFYDRFTKAIKNGRNSFMLVCLKKRQGYIAYDISAKDVESPVGIDDILSWYFKTRGFWCRILQMKVFLIPAEVLVAMCFTA